jgi:YspA, cpYpsA-related SLOG family
VKRLLVTGSRHWTDHETVVTELARARAELGDDTVLVHGEARGADRTAAWIWRGTWRLPVEAHPVNWTAPCRGACKPHHRRAKPGLGGLKVCPAAGMHRNADMVALGADLCFAFILDQSPGATGCARLARKAGITVRPFTAVSS